MFFMPRCLKLQAVNMKLLFFFLRHLYDNLKFGYYRFASFNAKFHFRKVFSIYIYIFFFYSNINLKYLYYFFYYSFLTVQ